MEALPAGNRSVLTVAEFDLLWMRLGLGAQPVALRLPSPGRADGERLEAHTAGWTALRVRGLAGPAGPDPELVRLLRLLARPWRQLELRGQWGRPMRAVAVEVPGACVLAVRQDATVALHGCGPLPDALAAVLPPTRAGPVTEEAGRARIVAVLADGSGVLRRRPGVLTVVDGPRGRRLTTPDGVVLAGTPPAVREQVAALLRPP